jgi:hypothetical protein
MTQHVFSQLACLGTHTITGLLTTSGQQFSDWSADYRMYSKGRVESDALFASVRRTLCSRQEGPVVVALDDTRLRKTGKKTHGVKYMRDPMGPPFHTNLTLAQRFLQISMASSEADGRGRMIPLDWVHAPIPQKPKKRAEAKELEAYKQKVKDSRIGVVANKRLEYLRQQLDKDGLKDKRLWAAVDGGFTNKTVLKNLPENTSLVGRIRSDAKLYHLPCAQQERGRRRCYGERAPTPEELRQDESIPWQEIKAFFGGKQRTLRVKQLRPVRWRAAGGDKNLQMIVLAPTPYRLTKTGRLLYRKPAYLICTDPEADLRDVIQYYLWRWDIEVNFRDEKSILGVGEAQVRTIESVQNVTACAVAAYAMLLTAATKVKDATDEVPVLPPPKWHRKRSARASTMDLVRNLRNQLLSRSINFSGFAVSQQADTKPEKSYFEPNSAVIYACTYS